MGKLKQWYFYYGSIITAILENNPEASPTLLVNEESKQVYKIKTRNSKEEYILYLKYASCRQGKEQLYNSWVFNFTEDDKERLERYHSKDGVIFIYLLCLKENMQNSEIAVLKYDEYTYVKNKSAITIGAEKNKRNFYLFTGESKSRSEALLVRRNRIGYSFHKLLEDEVYFNESLKPGEILKKNIGNDGMGSIPSYEDSMICPICGRGKLRIAESNDFTYHFAGKKCPECGAIFLKKKDYKNISRAYGKVSLKNNVCIMNWKDNTHEEFYIDTKKKQSEITNAEGNSNLIYTLPYDDNICPIHHNIMTIRTISFGRYIKDTVYYCERCKRLYVEKSRKSNLSALIQNRRTVSTYKLSELPK